MNFQSYGVAFVGNYMEKKPTPKALQTGQRILRQYNPEQILGHGEVITKDGQKVDTVCPGITLRSGETNSSSPDIIFNYEQAF